MEKVLVIGTGFMGRGIAQVCAQSGYEVYFKYNTTKTLEKAMDEIKWSLEKLGGKGLLKDSPKTIIEQMVKEGRLGRKVGKGFYDYTPDGKRLPWGNKGQT